MTDAERLEEIRKWTRRGVQYMPSMWTELQDARQDIPFLLEMVNNLNIAIAISGFDVSPCITCGRSVVCIPDGQPMCEPCALAEDQTWEPCARCGKPDALDGQPEFCANCDEAQDDGD